MDNSSAMVYGPVSVVSCESLVKSHHYSQRMPSTIQLCYGHVSQGPPRATKAVVIFSSATGRSECDNLWELTRLVRTPDYTPPLTKLISKSLGHVRQHKLADLIVSFADVGEGHHGGIYQSCSWLYSGCVEPRVDGFNVDGLFVPARTCNQRWGSSSLVKLKEALQKSEVVPHYDSGKHKYWKALTAKGMQDAIRIGLRSVPYPKPLLRRDDDVFELRPITPVVKKGVVKLPGVKRIDPDTQRVDVGVDLL